MLGNNRQGLLKNEGKAKFGEEFSKWQKQADVFSIDGHAPVRELWYRASLAWQDILNPSTAVTGSSSDDGSGGSMSSGEVDDDWRCALLVAHNAVNQALIGSALGLPPHYFRRLLQVGGVGCHQDVGVCLSCVRHL